MKKTGSVKPEQRKIIFKDKINHILEKKYQINFILKMFKNLIIPNFQKTAFSLFLFH